MMIPGLSLFLSCFSHFFLFSLPICELYINEIIVCVFFCPFFFFLLNIILRFIFLRCITIFNLFLLPQYYDIIDIIIINIMIYTEKRAVRIMAQTVLSFIMLP